MAENTGIVPPDITGVINQQFFIEPKGGPRGPKSYLEEFPETLYNTTLESNLVALMYALLGPVGIGAIRKNYLEARLDIEENGLSAYNLDELYANPFSFARLAFETYEENIEGLLTNSQWEKIRESDKSYQNRAINYLKAIRAGGTLLGLTLAGKSGLNRAVEVIENYRALYDQYSDDPLGLEKLGVTDSTEEVILLPRQEISQNDVQVLSVEGTPLTGTFKLALPIGTGETNANFSPSNTTTATLPYNATFNEVQTALEALSRVRSNIAVRGGPFPGRPIEVEFIAELADRPIPQLLVFANTLLDVEEHLTHIKVEITKAGVAADGSVASIPPEDLYYAQVAIDNIKPVTTIVTPGKATNVTKRQVANTIASDSEFNEVLRYVTGRGAVNWPTVDTTHWIEGGIEKEAPISRGAQRAHYLNYHDIWNITAYNQKALEDPHYETTEWPEFESKYKDEKVGAFSGEQVALYPFLRRLNREMDPTKPIEFFATNAVVAPPELLTFTDLKVIDTSYPSDYIALIEAEEKAHGLAQTAFGKIHFRPSLQDKPANEQAPIWSSEERTEGSDFLEIDLGSVEAVNYLSFEASNKPYDFEVAYDVLDASPERRFIPVSYVDSRIAKSIRSLGYEIRSPNQWRLIEMNFQNALDMMIYTRFIRLACKKRTGRTSPFTLENEELLPFSLEIRNLRIGRIISGSLPIKARSENEKPVIPVEAQGLLPSSELLPGPEVFPE